MKKLIFAMLITLAAFNCNAGVVETKLQAVQEQLAKDNTDVPKCCEIYADFVEEVTRQKIRGKSMADYVPIVTNPEYPKGIRFLIEKIYAYDDDPKEARGKFLYECLQQ